MQTITYRQAADLLEVKYATIKNAVLYGKLTRCATPAGEASLLKEQVELFKSKRISTKSLNLEEKNLWQEYKKIAENTELLALATREVQTNETASVLIAREIAKAGYEARMEKIDNALKEIRNLLDSIQMEREQSYPRMPLALK